MQEKLKVIFKSLRKKLRPILASAQETPKTNPYREKGLAIATVLFQVCVAFMPILHLLNVPLLNISLGTILLILFLPYSAFHLWNWYEKEKPQWKKFTPFISFAAFYLYLFLRANGSITHMMLSLVTLIHLCGMFCGSIQVETIRKIVIGYAMANVGIVLIQTLAFYLLDWHIQLLPHDLIHAQFQGSYVFRELSGLYRPSALFLEPSHFAQYCCFAQICVLFPWKGKPDLQRACVIAVGCFLTTSGMGIVLSMGIFLWYFSAQFLLTGKFKAFKPKQILKWAAIGLVCAILVCQIPFVKTALQRVFSTVDGYNAIYGRLGLWKWKNAIGTMKPLTLLFGYGSTASYSYYLTGLADTIYKFGLVGMALELYCFGYLMFKKRTHYVWCTCFVFLLLFCVAHLTSFFNHFFYFGLAILGVVYCKASAEPFADKPELTNKDIKTISYRILTNVAEFCENNGIQYFLVCGTALGAIRHNGFIPWDDDVDIGMPRADYERFIALYRSKDYVVCDTRFDKKYPYAFAKVCDRHTTLIEHIENPCDLGVYIDVFPIDGLPDDEQLRNKHLKQIEWDLRLLTWKRIPRDRKLDLLHKGIQLFAKTILHVVPVHVLVRKLEYDVKKYPYAHSRYVAHLVTKATWGTDIKPKKVFDNPVRHVFEKHELFVPGQVDAYLTLEYGDYMQLPPVEKQTAAHDYVAYRK